MAISNSTDNVPSIDAAETPPVDSLRTSEQRPCAMSDTSGPEDRSLDIACRLGNARAIADLVQMVCGSSLDGSDSQIDELARDTLRAAMYCIQQEIEAVEELIPRQTEFDGKLAVQWFAERAQEVLS